MESRFWRRAARRRLGRFLIKIRRSASACVIACSVARILSSWREGDDRRERREGDSRKPRPRRRPPLAGETLVAPPIESSHWVARIVVVGTRRLRPFRRGEGWGEKASERGREPRTTSVPLRISFRALVRASEVPSPPLLLSSPLASLLSRRRGSSLCRGRSPPPRPTTTRTTPATRGAAAAAAAAATTRHK